MYKPVGFVSYGGVAAGTRAVQQLEQVVTTLKISAPRTSYAPGRI
jgi:NAD(P)H-dependent FMN reductase